MYSSAQGVHLSNQVTNTSISFSDSQMTETQIKIIYAGSQGKIGFTSITSTNDIQCIYV